MLKAKFPHDPVGTMHFTVDGERFKPDSLIGSIGHGRGQIGGVLNNIGVLFTFQFGTLDGDVSGEFIDGQYDVDGSYNDYETRELWMSESGSYRGNVNNEQRAIKMSFDFIAKNVDDYTQKKKITAEMDLRMSK